MNLLKKIAIFRNDNDFRVLLSNATFLSLLQIVNYALPLVTMPYLAKTLGLERYGLVAFSVASIAYFQAFVDFGFNYTGVREIAQNRSNKENVSRVFYTIMFSRFLLIIISFVVLLFLCLTLDVFRNNAVLLIFTYTYIPFSVLSSDWFFQAMEDMKFITFVNVISKIIFTLLVFVFIKTEEDYIMQPLLITSGYCVASVFSFSIILFKYKLNFSYPSMPDMIVMIKDSFHMFVNIFIPNIYSNLSIILLQSFWGAAAVGIFDAGNKFVNLSQQVSNILSRVFYPFLARRIEMHSFYRKLSFVIAIILSLFLFLGAEFLIKLFYSSQFDDSVNIIRAMSIMPILFNLINVYGTEYLVLMKKEQLVSNITVVTSIIGFVIASISVKILGYWGVVITLLGVRSLMGLLLYFYYRRDVKYKMVKINVVI